MKLEIDLHVRGIDLDKPRYLAVIERLNNLEKTTMATSQQTAADLKALNVTVTKIGQETTAILEKVTTLEAAIADAGGGSQEVEAALADLKTSIEQVDSLVADAPTEPAP